MIKRVMQNFSLNPVLSPSFIVSVIYQNSCVVYIMLKVIRAYGSRWLWFLAVKWRWDST